MKLLLFVLFLYFCFFFCNITSSPIFEVVNDYDSHGQKCPLFPQHNVECPVICVADHSLCPSKLSPTCPPGLSFCGDGTCKQSCAGIENACQCGEATSNTKVTNYIPCAANQLVNISHFDPVNQVQQIRNVCQLDANMTMSPSVWGTFDSTSVWLECPIVEPFFTWKEPMWIVIWSISALEATILLAWHIYKRIRESLFRGKRQYKNTIYSSKFEDAKSPQASSCSEDVDNLRLRGFKNSILGWIAYLSVIITTCLLIVFLACIVSDYYGALSGIELGVFLSIDLSAKVFIAVWHITAAWLFVLVLYKDKLRNYFRLESDINSSTYIQVAYKKDKLIFLDDENRWVSKLQILEKRVTHLLGGNIFITTCPVQESNAGHRWFEYRCMRYVYQKDKSDYIPCTINLGEKNSILSHRQEGLTTEQASERLMLLGSNIIKVEIPSIPLAILQEFASFIYLYQIMCEWIWYYFQYYKMAVVQTCIILLSAFIRISLRLRAEYRIKEMSEHISEVTILRDGKWVSNLSTGDLVPGDVFEVEENTIVPCDSVLLSGTVVVNESALTGEAMPIRKFPISNNDTPYEKNGNSKVNTLFAGTIVSQVTPSTSDRVFALVLHTGIASEKGMLIHKILFPAPVSFIFNEHIKVAISILLVWCLVAFCLTLYLIGFNNVISWFYGMFIISEIFSPLLFAAFTINQSVCAARLRTKNILCIDLPRINLSGKVRIFCFDKTGTLTREGLEFFGGVVTTGEKKSFTPCEENPLSLEPTLATGIATCHAVTKLKDQFIGNPVDIESFRAMKWDLLPPTDSQYLDTLKSPSSSPNEKEKLVHVIRRFEFVHARASQSVAVLDEQTQRVHVYLKGSFERVKYLSVPESIPERYDEEAAKYAQEGCYVLAMSHRDLGVLGEDITMEQVKTMTRDELEQDCHFAGFILFRNMLKHDTTEAIAELKGGDTRVVMITGDTALTGIFIARQCGMIGSSQRVILGDFVSGNMVWRDVDSGDSVDVDKIIEEDLHEPHEKNIELALTGRAFEALIAHDKIRNYLLMTRVFARMTPNDKVMCVQLHMEKGVTAMCGDGGNDCGALRAAHVGLALSEAEASIVSPFSTNNRSVMQCVELLRQGRSGLATSLANYKYLIFYGQIMGFFELTMYYFSTNSTEAVWITIDGFITTFMTLAITQALPAKKLASCRPTAKPLGAYTLASILGVVFINFWFMCGSIIWLFQQDWFICNEFDSSSINKAKWWLLGDNYETMMVSLIALFQFTNGAAVVNFGSQFRRCWLRNYLLVLFYICFLGIFSYIILADPNPLGCIYRVNCGSPSVLVSMGYPEPTWDIAAFNSPIEHTVLPKWFRWQLWGYVLANCACAIIWERVCILWIARDWAIKRKKTNPAKNRVLFKL